MSFYLFAWLWDLAMAVVNEVVDVMLLQPLVLRYFLSLFDALIVLILRPALTSWIEKNNIDILNQIFLHICYNIWLQKKYFQMRFTWTGGGPLNVMTRIVVLCCRLGCIGVVIQCSSASNSVTGSSSAATFITTGEKESKYASKTLTKPVVKFAKLKWKFYS